MNAAAVAKVGSAFKMFRNNSWNPERDELLVTDVDEDPGSGLTDRKVPIVSKDDIGDDIPTLEPDGDESPPLEPTVGGPEKKIWHFLKTIYKC